MRGTLKFSIIIGKNTNLVWMIAYFRAISAFRTGFNTTNKLATAQWEYGLIILSV